MENLPGIKAYTLSNCPHCNALEKFVEDKGLVVDFINMDHLDWKEKEAALLEIEKICPDCGFPIIVIGERVINGFDPDAIKDVLGI